MIQIFILGSSSAYGVGAQTTGWGDLVKQYFHQKMYAPGGSGEKYEVFNFGKAGVTLDFVTSTFPKLLEQYGRGGEVITIYGGGRNNAKAENTPDNFVSTVETYVKEMEDFITLLKQHSSKVIVVGNGAVDESKTYPKHNPLTGGKSYFANARNQEFGNAAEKLCKEQDVVFVGIDIPQKEWVQKYLYDDGLHANQAGHQLIFELIKPHLDV